MSRQLSRHPGNPNAVGLVLTAIILVLFFASPAAALDTGACTMEILVDGRPLAEHPARRTTYIEALRSKEYAVRLRNNTGRRIAVALAVDGLNSIDAKTTTAQRASKWVLGPHETITIGGWQVSGSTARRFFFTTEDHSYGAWLGKTDDLGVIEAVVFRERLPLRVQQDELPLSGASRERDAAAGAPSAPKKESAGEALSDEFAATGIGRRVDNPVRRVYLDLEPEPAARLRLRYEYREQLVRLGVLPSPEEQRALRRREGARGFSDFEFSPDPGDIGR
jgi:hypothetical protein